MVIVTPGQKSSTTKGMTAWAILLFVVISSWWLFIHPFNSSTAVNSKNIWSASYELISILGGIFGVIISRYWQGRKSVVGRAILVFSIGLFLQSFGQVVYNYYTLFAKIEVPYPSIGDIGYFGSVIVYIYGALLLTKASGMNFKIKSTRNLALAILLPLCILVLSYFIFLSNYQNTGSSLTTFLDFGYPLGQAIYVAVALLAVFMSRDYLGGLLRQPISLFLVALIIQYVCDFDFLYQANHSLWFAGSFGDYLYAVSYFTMTIAIINIGNLRLKLNEQNP